MVVALVSDVHLGNFKRFGGPSVASLNERCRLALASFQAAVHAANKRKADTFIVAGDLFDYDHPEPQLLTEVQGILRSFSGSVYLLVGNHEQATTSEGDHALGPLTSDPRVEVIERPTALGVHGGILLVPFRPGVAKEWLRDAIRAILPANELAGEVDPPTSRLLVFHLGIRDEKTPPWLRDAGDAIDVRVLAGICSEFGITHVVAGNWHNHAQWHLGTTDKRLHIVQCGALVPTGFDNPGFGYGKVVFSEEGRPPEVHGVHGPRFTKASTRSQLDDLLVKARRDNAGSTLYVSATAAPEDLAEYTTILQGAAAAHLIHAFEVLPDEQVAQAEARTAARMASDASTADEAMAAFVAAMPLPEDVMRERVLTRVQDYLK